MWVAGGGQQEGKLQLWAPGGRPEGSHTIFYMAPSERQTMVARGRQNSDEMKELRDCQACQSLRCKNEK